MSDMSHVIQSKLDQMSAKRPANALRGRLNRAKGEVTQTCFQWRLLALGVQMVETVHSAWIVTRVKGKIVGAKPAQKVNGDFRGVLPGGRSVLVEVKSREHLVFSDLEAHQVRGLDAHRAAGGLSMLGWQWPGGDALMVWPVVGFGPGKGMTPAQALALNVTRIRQ